MREVAIASGVPAEAILLERESTSTRENLLFARPILEARGFRTVALVTSGCHVRRAAAVARRELPGIRWVVVPVEDAGPPSRVARMRVQEWAKLLLYTLAGWA
jgi:uncharacterized SAM-binding protein YcdF (DUF218 family)